MNQRQALADRVRVCYDVDLPRLEHWNYDPCSWHGGGHEGDWRCRAAGHDNCAEGHSDPVPGCQRCGVRFRRHQRVGITWLWTRKWGLLADPVGTGKTIHAAGVLAILKQRGELSIDSQAVLCVRASAVTQWEQELKRMVPSLQIITSAGLTAGKRRATYHTEDWEVLITSPQTLINDIDHVLTAATVIATIVDDVDAIRHDQNVTTKAVRSLQRRSQYRIVMTATPLQKQLEELYWLLYPLGGEDALGSDQQFRRRHVNTEVVKIWPRGKKSGKRRRSRPRFVNKVTGYKNMDAFKTLVAPMTLRRRVEDIDDVSLPSISTNVVHLDLLPAQRAAYNELREDTYTMEQSGSVSRLDAMAKIHHGAKICAGLGSLEEGEDGPGASVKLNWVLDELSGDMAEDKVVIFAHYKATVRCLQARLRQAGIEHVTIWGEERDQQLRQERLDRFTNDDDCKVLIGTTAIEQSLNLQVARHLICFDTILNPARMEQLAGRIRRDGSAHRTVYVHYLWTTDTQEAKYQGLLEREQALIDFVWDERSELFESVSPMELLRLISR